MNSGKLTKKNEYSDYVLYVLDQSNLSEVVIGLFVDVSKAWGGGCPERGPRDTWC